MRKALSILFAAAGVAQLIGPPPVRRAYARWGYSDFLRIAVGVIEIEAAVLVAFRPTRHVAVVQLVPLLSGAVYMHAKTPRERPLAVVPLLVVAAVLSVLDEDG